MKRIFFIGWTLVMLMTACKGTHIEVVFPKVEMQENPEGLATLNPRFSWQLASTMNDLVQQSYQIQVAASEDAFNKEEERIWDSGMVQDDQSVLIPYAGNELLSGETYYWRVKVVTN
jgi:alpha-L-rhamnosidase